MASDHAFYQQLRETFRQEAAERLREIADGLLEIEKMPSNESGAALVDIVFRAAHSLKGAARAVGQPGVESPCEALEELSAAWKHSGGPVSPADLAVARELSDEIAAELSLSAATNSMARAESSRPNNLHVSDSPAATKHEFVETPAPQSVLVAEDSITSRMRLKSILEAAGYVVKTAVDGVDAYAQLQAGDFDLLVSDVEMPRMNGFDLTARVRADCRLSDLPVVLVTALDSPEDRLRGLDAGASAYLTKMGFERSKLIDAVRHFIGMNVTR